MPTTRASNKRKAPTKNIPEASTSKTALSPTSSSDEIQTSTSTTPALPADGFSSPLSSPPSTPASTPPSLSQPDPSEGSALVVLKFTARIKGFVKIVAPDYKWPRTRKVARQSNPKLKPAPYLGRNVENNKKKPLPFGRPLVWATTRTLLCEGVWYFRAFQGGVYSEKKIGSKDSSVIGFLCDGEVLGRDYFDDQIMITTLGGGRIKDEEGKTKRVDQPAARNAPFFLTNKKHGFPIAMIVGENNSISPSRLPHAYNILDWFQVTDVWCETHDGVRVWMVRLEKINLDEKSWWAPIDAVHSTPDFNIKAPLHKCQTCGVESKTRFEQGWTCMNHHVKTGEKCSQFMKFEPHVDDKTLTYSQEFLKERTKFQGSTLPPLINPPFDSEELHEEVGWYGIGKRGFPCPKCGCCITQVRWGHWTCQNTEENCDFDFAPSQQAVTVEIANSTGNIDKKTLGIKEAEFVDPAVGVSSWNWEGYKVNKYTLPDEVGGTAVMDVFHLKAGGVNSALNKEKNGADQLLEMMQNSAEEMKLKRNPVKNAGKTNELFTAHWGTNYGVPYKFIVKQESRTFSDAPFHIIETLKKLRSAAKHGVEMSDGRPDTFLEFNEILAVGYRGDGSKMSYHDDGESTLGPTVASLSLGCDATMHWRVKKTTDDSLRIVLEHGDIMIMHGAKMQKLYEHSAMPHGSLRFAITSRHIDFDKLAPEDRDYAKIAAILPPADDEDYNNGLLISDQDGNDRDAIGTLSQNQRDPTEFGEHTSENLGVVGFQEVAISSQEPSITPGAPISDPAEIQQTMERKLENGEITHSQVIDQVLGWNFRSTQTRLSQGMVTHEEVLEQSGQFIDHGNRLREMAEHSGRVRWEGRERNELEFP